MVILTAAYIRGLKSHCNRSLIDNLKPSLSHRRLFVLAGLAAAKQLR